MPRFEVGSAMKYNASPRTTHPLATTAIGQILRLASKRRVYHHPEEHPDFDIKEHYPFFEARSKIAPIPCKSSDEVNCCENSGHANPKSFPDPEIENQVGECLQSERLRGSNEPTDKRPHLETGGATVTSNPKNILLLETQPTESIIVTWYGENDSENPQNWSLCRKMVVYIIINYCTFAIYSSSAIFTPSMLELPSVFGISKNVAALGLAMFVFGYGFGPLLGAPLSEVPAIGRNPPYIISLTLFVIIGIPTALAKTIPSLMALRFLQGFVGSPILATGGASLAEVTHPQHVTFALYSWAIFSFIGPAAGPIISGYTIANSSWRLPLWEIVWITSPALLMLLFLPETSASSILYQRAKRLRERTGDARFVSFTDIKQRPFHEVLMDTFLISWKINILDPSILFTTLYCSLVYAIYYLFFEAFPLVYMEIYGMQVGEMGLVYLCIPISVCLAGIPYLMFARLRMLENQRTGKARPPEDRLIPALFACLTTPAGLFIFAWTSRANIHWIVPTIGVALSSSGMAIILQSIFVYIANAYPRYAASLFGVNGFMKATVSAAVMLAAPSLYGHMGISGGTSLLGGLCILFIAGIYPIYFFGDYLRKKSKFTK